MYSRSTKTSTHARQGGFTLIEVLVSLSLFTIVVTISVSTLLVLIDANSKSQSMQVVMSNLSFALDSMTREIRTGDSYYCHNNSGQLPTSGTDNRDCANGEGAFAFNEGGESITGMVCSGAGCSRRIAYRLNGTTIERRLGSTSQWVPVTSPDVVIEELDFVVTGSTPGDNVPPTVTIYLTGRVGNEAQTGSEFQIQTTVTQILLDV